VREATEMGERIGVWLVANSPARTDGRSGAVRWRGRRPWSTVLVTSLCSVGDCNPIDRTDVPVRMSFSWFGNTWWILEKDARTDEEQLKSNWRTNRLRAIRRCPQTSGSKKNAAC